MLMHLRLKDSIAYIFVADCIYLSLFCLAWWVAKVNRSRANLRKRRLTVTVIQGHRICHQSKRHMRLSTSGY